MLPASPGHHGCQVSYNLSPHVCHPLICEGCVTARDSDEDDETRSEVEQLVPSPPSKPTGRVVGGLLRSPLKSIQRPQINLDALGAPVANKNLKELDDDQEELQEGKSNSSKNITQVAFMSAIERSP